MLYSGIYLFHTNSLIHQLVELNIISSTGELSFVRWTNSTLFISSQWKSSTRLHTVTKLRTLRQTTSCHRTYDVIRNDSRFNIQVKWFSPGRFYIKNRKKFTSRKELLFDQNELQISVEPFFTGLIQKKK